MPMLTTTSVSGSTPSEALKVTWSAPMKKVPSGFLPVAVKTNLPFASGAAAVPCAPCVFTR